LILEFFQVQRGAVLDDPPAGGEQLVVMLSCNGFRRGHI